MNDSLLTGLLPQGFEEDTELEVVLDDLVVLFAVLNSFKDLLLKSHLASGGKELNNLALLALLDCVIGPGVQDLLKLVDLCQDLEPFDLLLLLPVVAESFKALTKDLIVLLLPKHALEFGLFRVHPQGIDCLLQDFVDEEVSADHIQLLLVSLSDAVLL